MSIDIHRDRSVLLLVDLQPDFFPGGALPVAEGGEIVQPICDLLELDLFGVYAATQDWHPPDHVSFASQHPGRSPHEVIELYGHQQVLWPDHCVQGTRGAELHPDLPWNQVAAVIRKGIDAKSDSYSGFRNNWNPEGERPTTGLAGYLRELGVEQVFLCGLTRDYCVKWSAEDAAAEGFDTYFLWHLTRSVDPSGDDGVRRDLEAAGVRIVEPAELEG
jgi:nicotinamidase/pyrazinamidase